MATRHKNKKVAKHIEVEEDDQKPKSKIMLAREKYPEGIGYIANMRAVLK